MYHLVKVREEIETENNSSRYIEKLFRVRNFWEEIKEIDWGEFNELTSLWVEEISTYKILGNMNNLIKFVKKESKEMKELLEKKYLD